jgi:tRNA A37 methylthiotransferase MiaB
VIEYVGRKQRHKPVDLVLRELDALYRFGYRTVFLADDNFTVYRARAKELLAAIQEWNARQTDGRVRFTTQISIDAAGDTGWKCVRTPASPTCSSASKLRTRSVCARLRSART